MKKVYSYVFTAVLFFLVNYIFPVGKKSWIDLMLNTLIFIALYVSVMELVFKLKFPDKKNKP